MWTFPSIENDTRGTANGRKPWSLCFSHPDMVVEQTSKHRQAQRDAVVHTRWDWDRVVHGLKKVSTKMNLTAAVLIVVRMTCIVINSGAPAARVRHGPDC